MPISAELPVWPGDPPIVLERYEVISEGNTSNDSRIACSVHSGTHVDAPAHFIENGASVEQLPLNVLIGPAIVVEVPTTGAIKPDILEALTLVSWIPHDCFLKRATRPCGRTPITASTRTLWHSALMRLYGSHAKGIRLVGIDYLSVQIV